MICPFCGSDSGEIVETGLDHGTYEEVLCQCSNCGEDWEDEYYYG